MTCQPLPVNLATSLTICQTIEGLLQDSLGPNALHTMLTSPSGNVVITSDGYTLLTSLHLSHPVARWIVGQVKGHHGTTGDNAKSFILIVTEILRQLQNAVVSKDTNSANSSKQDLIQIGQALQTIQSDVFPRMVLPALLEHCVRLDLVEASRKDVLSICKKIIRTALGGKFSKLSTDHVAELTVDLVCGSCHDSRFREVIQELISEYDVACLEVPNQPVSKSKLLDGVVLTRNFVIQSEGLDSLTTVPFVILNCSLDKWIPEVHSTLVTGNSNELMKAFHYGISQAWSLINHLEKCHVKLLLSSVLLSDVTLSFCRAAGISAVHMIPEEELNRLSRLTKTDIVCDPSDIMMPALKIGNATFCRSLSLGQHVGIHFGFSDGASMKQLILCAPTQGICRQWFMAVFNTLKTLHMWLDTSWFTGVRDEDNVTNSSCEKPSSEEMHVTTGCGSEDLEHSDLRCSDSAMRESADVADVNISQRDSSHFQECRKMSTSCKQEAFCVPGGGCTEFLLHKLFQSLASSNSRDCSPSARDHSLAVAFQILNKAALCIPRNLHRNSFAAKSHQKLSFIEMASKAKDAADPVGINGRTGALCDPTECGILEPLSGRLKLWRDAINTVQDLLRIDMIVAVRTLPRDECTDTFSCDNSDDDDE